MKRMRIQSGHILVILLVLAIFILPMSAIASDKDLPTVTWRCQSAWPPPEAIAPGSKYFGGYGMTMDTVRRVKEKTNGKFIIKVYTPNTLFKTRGILPAVRAGAIEMATINGAYLKGKIPSAAIECISVGGPRDAKRLVPMFKNSEWLEIVRRDYARFGVHYVGALPCANSVFMTNFPIHKLSDLKGHKVAASGSKGDLIKIVGGVSTTIHGTDLYPALQRGTVDGIVYPAYCLNTYKFYEVTKYLIWAGIQNPLCSNIISNLDAYQKLPAEYQKALDEACLEVTINQLNGSEEIDDIARGVAQKHGIEQITFDDTAFAEVRDVVIPIWDKLAAKTEDNAKLIAILKKYSYGE